MRAEAVILDAEEGIVVSAPHTERLLILGGGRSGKGFPSHNWDGEVWSPNFLRGRDPINGDKPQLATTRLFQIHPLNILTKREAANFIECPVPVYTLKDESAHNPNSVVYPWDRVREAVGPGPCASSFDFMLPLAIAEGFTDIHLAGVDLQGGTPRERLCEHVSLCYWIGVAVGRGLTVRNYGFALKFPLRYGYDFQAERTWGQRMAFWAALAGLNFQFDDGGATTAPMGWTGEFSPRRVKVGI